MNEERTGKCLRQVEHIRGHLWHWCSLAVNQVMVVTHRSHYYFFVFILEFTQDVTDTQMGQVAPVILPEMYKIFMQAEVCIFEIVKSVWNMI